MMRAVDNNANDRSFHITQQRYLNPLSNDVVPTLDRLCRYFYNQGILIRICNHFLTVVWRMLPHTLPMKVKTWNVRRAVSVVMSSVALAAVFRGVHPCITCMHRVRPRSRQMCHVRTRSLSRARHILVGIRVQVLPPPPPLLSADCFPRLSFSFP